MVFVEIVAGCIFVWAIIRLRIVYSATYIHVIHFRSKILAMANNDPYWYGVYAALPSQKKHIFLSNFVSMKSFMDKEAQERYILEILPQHEIKRSRREVSPLSYEI